MCPTQTPNPKALGHFCRCAALESEKDKLADDLSYAVTLQKKLEGQVDAIPKLKSEVVSLKKRQAVALEVSGGGLWDKTFRQMPDPTLGRCILNPKP
jgi:hypothetical protein